VKVLIKNRQKIVVNTVNLNRILLIAMEYTNQRENSEVSLLLTDDQEIRELNKKYRGIDSSTDVLSFGQMDEKDNPQSIFDIEKELLLGDIVISVETAQKQALSMGHSLIDELYFLSIHGFLHLIGFDHYNEDEKIKMMSLENKIIEKYFSERINRNI
jgi:probable rRNA maturation factor